MDWEHDVYETWRVVFGRVSLPPIPRYTRSIYDQAVRDIQEQEDRRVFEMLNVGPLPELLDRFQKIDRDVLDNLRA